MRLENTNKPTYWPIIISLLILATLIAVAFSGLNGMVNYRKITGIKLDYNLENLHLFTKEYLQRQIQKYSVDEFPEDSNLPSFYISIDDQDIASLEADLPLSGKLQFVQGHLKVDNPDFNSEAKIRYRGGLDFHWLYEKKSLRIKLPPFYTYKNERQFNLVNPSTIHTVIDWLSYDMSRSIGLLTPEYFPSRVFINNESNGLHYYLSQIDESFLRKNNRMPGSIYSGDTFFSENIFGKVSGLNEISYRTADDKAALWTDKRLWKKDASRNRELVNDHKDIDNFFRIINESDPIKFMKEFETYFDKNKYYLYWSLDNIVGSYHHDLFHNHKMYFDPYKGKFEPIEWDVRFWTTNAIMPVTPLIKQILLNPILKYENDIVMYDLWNKFSLDYVLTIIDHADESVKNELAADPYRHYPNIHKYYLGLSRVVPFSMDEYRNAIDELKQIYKVRHKYIEKMLKLSTANYQIEEISDTQIQVTIAVDGNSPIDFTPWSIMNDSAHENVEIFRIFEDQTYPLFDNGQLERLYPGIAISKRTDVAKLPRLVYLSYGDDIQSSSPIHYRYLLRGTNISDLISSHQLTGRNAITNNMVTIDSVENLPANDQTLSLHPWKLLLERHATEKDVVLQGEIDVDQDLVFTKEQEITILPGTVFKISKNNSILFYGKVLAIGTADLPIRFERKFIGQAWGSIILQGNKASGSRLSHINISGGSVASHNLIQYPGQLNIHDVKSFQLDHCYISNNSIGDDAVHIAYSHGEIQHCTFKNTAFDALDMDISDVKVSNSGFFNIGNDALDLMNSEITINNVNISGSGDKCISVGEASNVTVENSQLENCQTGIAVKDQSIAHIENIQFTIKQGNAIALYRKNPRYSSGGEIYGDKLFGITEKDIVVGDNSSINIHKSAYMPLTKPYAN